MGPFTLDEIPDALAAHLPASGSVEHPPQGMTSDVAFVTGPDRSVAVKRCADPIYLSWLRRERAVLCALADAALPVPAVFGYIEVPRAAGPEAWLVMSRLAGRSLWRAMLDTRSGARAPLLRSLGELLRRLHSTPMPRALTESSDWLSRQLLQARENLAWCDGTAELLTSLERTRPEPVPEVLIHGDFALDNVLIDESGRMSIIDWSNGGSGDYRSDIALALQTEPEIVLAEEEVEAFYAGYASCAPLDRGTRRWFEALYEFF
jgi:aminoglycoside phosphotransferase (APT) family kinase protein